MASTTLHMLTVTAILLFSAYLSTGADDSSLQTYIILVRRPDHLLNSDDDSLQNYYLSFLRQTAAASSPSTRLLYSYREAISGFAARLTAKEAAAMSSMTGFLHAYPSPSYRLMTTRTPAFLNLHSNAGLWDSSNQGEGVIIAMIDTGVASAHLSFSDAGMSPPPPRWKAACHLPPTSPCNKKLIGAWALGSKVASDHEGHGTHTASTAGGNFVGGAALFGQANGTASGIAPRAHLSVYKVCYHGKCGGQDLTAGIDAALQDGVNVVSLSLGGGSIPFAYDPIAIAGFHAFEKGITFVCAAGNDGPYSSTLSNEAPWLITVGSSTVDRMLKAVVRLGDGQEFAGEAIFQPSKFSSKQLPLVLPTSCNNLSAAEVKGKIVLCDSIIAGPGFAVKAAGGAAVIIRNFEDEGFTTMVRLQPIPSSLVTFKDGEKIAAYARDLASNPTATIEFSGTVIGSPPPPAPMMAYFSSRGPSFSSPGILKPDIIAPGVNVLAAWPHDNKISRNPAKSFYIASGTSMATPHITGVVALLKNSHPNWSPAAIKSAIMTTATVVDNSGNPIMDEKLKPADHFAVGAGHVNPERASDPGLIYNITGNDYIRYLCGMGYSDVDVLIISGREVSCARTGKIAEAELNYPSILVALNADNTSNSVTVKRTVTNVGPAQSTYTVEVESPKGVKVAVKPTELKFSSSMEEMMFSVTFERNAAGPMDVGSSVQGSLKWVSEKRVVRSPIVVML